MNLTAIEQNFVTHIRTLHLKSKSTRKEQTTEYVSISMKIIKDCYFQNEYENVFHHLKQLNEIDFQKVTTSNGAFYYKFKALKDGPIDFSILKGQSRKLDNLERIVKSHLRWVSIQQGIESTIYFQHFLNQKEKYLDAFFLVDTFSGRIHTPITSLQGSIRKHLLLKNEAVTSLDVAQMQPLLLSLLLKENIGSNEFTEWIEQGEDVYLKFKEKLNLQSRDEAKSNFYKITFGTANQKLADLFGNSNWIEWINEVKSYVLHQNPNSTKKTHSNLAWLLQSTEVNIMRSIWQKLIANDILFFTVHDAVYVRDSDLDEAYKIMFDELSFYFKTFNVNIESISSVF